MKFLWITFLALLTLATFGFIFRYDYLTLSDVSLRTPIMNDILLNSEVYRPIRFDRWTGSVEIYLKKGKWSDLAEWNQEKHQTIQSSVRELSRAG